MGEPRAKGIIALGSETRKIVFYSSSDIYMDLKKRIFPCMEKYVFSKGQTRSKKQNREEKCDIPLSTALQRERTSSNSMLQALDRKLSDRKKPYILSIKAAWRTSLMNIRKERVSRPCATFRLNLVNYQYQNHIYALLTIRLLLSYCNSFIKGRTYIIGMLYMVFGYENIILVQVLILMFYSVIFS